MRFDYILIILFTSSLVQAEYNPMKLKSELSSIHQNLVKIKNEYYRNTSKDNGENLKPSKVDHKILNLTKYFPENKIEPNKKLRLPKSKLLKKSNFQIKKKTR